MLYFRKVHYWNNFDKGRRYIKRILQYLRVMLIEIEVDRIKIESELDNLIR